MAKYNYKQPSFFIKLDNIKDIYTTAAFRQIIEALNNLKEALSKSINSLYNGDIPVKVPSYTVATLPSASTYTNSIIYVSDETGGAVLAFSDATNWRRVTDRAIVS